MVGLEQIKLFGWLAAGGINPVGIYTFNSATLSWEPQAPITGGGGGGAVTIADGADVALGSTGDAPGTNTVVGQLKEIADSLAAPVAVSGPLTDAQLRAAAVPVSGPLTDAQLRAAAVPVSAAALPLPSGAATEATLATRAADATITARLNTLGQKTMAASAPVVIASNQSAVPVSGPLTDAQLRATPVPVSGAGGVAAVDTYTWVVPSTAVGANKLFLDLFNAAGSGKVIKIYAINPIVDTDVALTGALGIRIIAMRTSTVGTGGTAAAYKSATINVAGGNISPHDTNSSDLPAQVSARHLLTGGATNAEWLRSVYVAGEETATSLAYNAQGQLNMVPLDYQGKLNPITLREGQGLKLLQGAIAATGNTAFQITFSAE